MINKDKIINQRDAVCEKQTGRGARHGISVERPILPATRREMCLPSMSPLGLSVPKGSISVARPIPSAARQKMFFHDLRIGGLPPRFVPVVDQNNKPLMPTKLSRALSWIYSRKATYFFVRGIFTVRLNQEPSARNYQEIALAIDPGSKKEGYTLKSKSHTYLNIQADAVTWVKDALEVRRNMRRSRRFRKTPCRQNRMNRKRGGIPPSTKARWAWKLRIINVLKRIFPISVFVVEDISAKTKEGKRRDGKPVNRLWNSSFSPLQVGKNWFYNEIRKLGRLVLKQGYETKELRDQLGLKKSKKKLEESWNAHCVDSWVLAWAVVGGKPKPDHTDIVYISPIQLHRRQLHRFQPGKGGVRRPYGGTRSMNLKRGSLVKHKDLGICYVGGVNAAGSVTFYEIATGKLYKRKYAIGDCRVLAWNTWRIWANSPSGTRPEVPLATS